MNTATRPAASVPHRPSSSGGSRFLPSVCCNGLMQFNTYTVAGAHVAVWLVNHPVAGRAGPHRGAAPPRRARAGGERRPTRWRCGPGRIRLREVFEAGTVPRKPDSPTRCSSPPTAARGWSATARVSLSTSITRRCDRPGAAGAGADRGRAGARDRRRWRHPAAGLRPRRMRRRRSSTPRATGAATSAASAAPTRSTWPATAAASGRPAR